MDPGHLAIGGGVGFLGTRRHRKAFLRRVANGHGDPAGKGGKVLAVGDLGKPFAMDELLARLRPAVRRVVPSGVEDVVITAAFSVDLAQKKAAKAAGSAVHTGLVIPRRRPSGTWWRSRA